MDRQATFAHPQSYQPEQVRPQIKVCHIAATTDGATWLFEQLRELRNRYLCGVTAVVSGSHGRLIDRLTSENIPFHVVDFAAGPGSISEIIKMPWSVLKLAWWFRRERFDIVHHHIFITMRIARPAAWLADVPVRISMISGPFHLQAPTSRWIEEITHWMDTMLLPSCEETVELCRGLGVERGRIGPVVYYGPDETRFDPTKITPLDIRAQFGWTDDTPVVCMVAFFYPRLSNGSWVPPEVRGRGIKGHGDFVRSAPIVLREFPTTKFLLVGSGWGELGEKYRDEIKQLVREMHLESNVFVIGYREDANRILAASDIAVQASLNENLGGTLESMLLGRPTVATRVGGLVDSVKDGETGVLVNPSDPKDLARGIMELLRDRAKAEALGNAGRRWMLERFTLARTVADLNSLYLKLIENRAQRRKPYSLLISVGRLIVSLPLFVYITTRLFFVDGYLWYKLASVTPKLLRKTALGAWLKRILLPTEV